MRGPGVLGGYCRTSLLFVGTIRFSYLSRLVASPGEWGRGPSLISHKNFAQEITSKFCALHGLLLYLRASHSQRGFLRVIYQLTPEFRSREDQNPLPPIVAF